MREFRRPLYYGGLSVKNELRQVHLYLVALITFFIIEYNFGGVADFLAEGMDRMNVFELYIHFMTSKFSQIFYLLGILAFSCGALFYSHGAAYYLIRGKRRSWALGQTAYLLVMVVGYNLFLILSLSLATGGHLTFANQWSTASFLAEQFSPRSVGIGPIISVSYNIMQMSPIAAGLITFLLSVLVGMAAGMVVIVSSMRTKGVFGVAILVIAWFADYVIENDFFYLKLPFLSPFGVSRLNFLLSNGGGLGILYGVAFFCILIVIEFVVLLRSVRKIDFVKLE